MLASFAIFIEIQVGVCSFRWEVAAFAKNQATQFWTFFQHVRKIFISELFVHVMVEKESTHRHLSKITFDFAYILV